MNSEKTAVNLMTELLPLMVSLAKEKNKLLNKYEKALGAISKMNPSERGIENKMIEIAKNALRGE